MMKKLPVLCTIVALAAFGCERKPSKFQAVTNQAEKSAHKTVDTGSTSNNDQQGSGAGLGAGSSEPAAPAMDIDSKDILARTETAKEVTVKHVLLGWKDLAGVYGPQMDPRAKGRDNAAAADLAKQIYEKLKATPDQIDALVQEHSEDPGSKTGEPYEVKENTEFVPEFKKLALRLKEKEAGIVKTTFGYHVIIRVPPPPLDPLENAEIFARPAFDGKVAVQHVLIGWKDVPAGKQRPVDPRAAKRTKEEADKLAQEILAKASAPGADMAALMKEFSEDPGSKDTGNEYQVEESTPFVEQFKKLALRLKEGEAALAKTAFGWHVIKRMPPDALQSNDILARQPVTQKSKVKHILLSWDKAGRQGQDPRGAKRTKAELEALIKKTVGQLNNKTKIEPLMKSLSEDPGSAESGKDYEVTPDAGLVPEFKALGLRLNVGETGVVKTQFGYHIIQRTE